MSVHSGDQTYPGPAAGLPRGVQGAGGPGGSQPTALQSGGGLNPGRKTEAALQAGCAAPAAPRSVLSDSTIQELKL
jgi:hypothetical protein